jgi:hypothetical protein
MLSHARRSSTGTARSVHSVPEISTPASQPGHWQPQHTYTAHVPSPHVEAPTNMSDMQAQHHEAVRWSPHPSVVHSQHHPVSIPVQDPPVHAVETSGTNYPGPYGVESNARAMSYPLENPSMITSQPMPMSGYGTPTSHASPHPSDYQRHISVPMSHQTVPQQGPYAHPPHHTSTPYTSYPNPPHQGYAPQVSHPEMMVHTPHPQAQMINEQGQHIVYHMQPNMKVEH